MPAPLALSNRVRDLRPSPIREMLSATSRPGMISFAGGLPAPETFPALSLTVPPAVLQYGATEGDLALREQIADEMRSLGLNCRPDQVLILSGSQQGIDLVAKLFIDPGTSVALEAPTYLAALQVFRFFGARFQAFCPKTPGTLLQGDRPAFVYAIPTFQNPTGYCYTREERAALAETVATGGIPLFEDDPYRDLAYDECERRPVCAELHDTPWIYQGSYSKTLAPGLRLGFLVSSPELAPLLARLKQAADLHSNRLSQYLVLEQLRDSGRDARLTTLVQHYREKRDVFAAALEQHFSDLAEWEVPRGGLFFWLRLKHAGNPGVLLNTALERGVVFMPGDAFYPGTSSPALRLNFSHASAEEVHSGLAVLAQLLREHALTYSADTAPPPHTAPA